MDMLQLLEQKISSLVAAVKDLKNRNEQLDKSIISTHSENQRLIEENGKLTEENDQLIAKLEKVEKKALEGNDQINELNQEKALTKMAVDDLLERLKSIDSFVEVEKQQ